IDERWFASTTEAANANRTVDEGLSYVLFEGQRFQLRDAVSEAGDKLIGKPMHSQYKRWPVYSKFFDNMGPIPHHMHQRFEDAKLVGQEGKPESYYFCPQYNNCDNNFAYTFMGLEPGTTKAQVRRCLENWFKGDNGILDLSRAYRLKRGSGWITVQGSGRIGKLNLQTPAMIRFGEETEDEVFISHEAAVRGVEVENTGSEPLVSLRYFGPDVHRNLPKVGDYRK